MLILVAVTVQIAVDSGLFGHAQDATSRYADKQAQEQSIGDGNVNIVINGVEYSSLEEVPGVEDPGTEDPAPTTPDRSYLSVGDYVDYKPDTANPYTLSSAVTGSSSNGTSYAQETTLQWRIMSINEDGSVDLISATPTSTDLYLYGALGYNNGVYVLNDLCEELYSNASLGVTARSLDLEDIESKMNATGIAARNAYNNGNKTYGQTQTYKDTYSYAPDAWDVSATTAVAESTDVYDSPTANTYAQKGSITVTQTYYYFSDTPATYFDDSTFHELIFGTGSYYWLASRYATCASPHAGFGFRRVEYSISNSILFHSSNNEYYDYLRVRPVVSLGSNIQISETGGTSDAPRVISKTSAN